MTYCTYYTLKSKTINEIKTNAACALTNTVGAREMMYIERKPSSCCKVSCGFNGVAQLWNVFCQCLCHMHLLNLILMYSLAIANRIVCCRSETVPYEFVSVVVIHTKGSCTCTCSHVSVYMTHMQST